MSWIVPLNPGALNLRRIKYDSIHDVLKQRLKCYSKPYRQSVQQLQRYRLTEQIVRRYTQAAQEGNYAPDDNTLHELSLENRESRTSDDKIYEERRVFLARILQMADKNRFVRRYKDILWSPQRRGFSKSQV